jgi:hypothetical protein
LGAPPSRLCEPLAAQTSDWGVISAESLTVSGLNDEPWAQAGRFNDSERWLSDSDMATIVKVGFASCRETRQQRMSVSRKLDGGPTAV